MSGPARDPEAERRADAQAAQHGVHRLALPTPFAVGRVNAYLIEDEPLTLVDTGPNSGTTLQALDEALAEHGRRAEEIELIVITHQHMDHFGLAATLARRSGAEVAALDVLAAYLASYSAEAALDDEYASERMLRHGVPFEYALALRAVSGSYRGWGARVQATQTLAEGSELKLRDRTLRVLRRPGHSPSDTVLHDADRRLLIAGDHLIKTISSNALLARPLPGDGGEGGDFPDHLDGRPAPLLAYADSMRATAAMDVDLVLPGHGPVFDRHVELVEERLRMQERRARKIAGLLADGLLSAREIAERMWGNVALTQAYLTLSEVLGHLDLLLGDGSVREVQDGELIRFGRT